MLKYVALSCALLLPTLSSAAKVTETSPADESQVSEECIRSTGNVLAAMLETSPPLFYLLDEDDSNNEPTDVNALNNMGSSLMRSIQNGCDETLLSHMATMIAPAYIEAAAESHKFNVRADMTPVQAVCHMARSEIWKLKRKAPRGYNTAFRAGDPALPWGLAIDIRENLTELEACQTAFTQAREEGYYVGE
ncbi:MAG: hypothetical protein VX676_02655 [Pseudomonadota bacterium]|nr:hypothetical protein [Pseudomonadota bacterium]